MNTMWPRITFVILLLASSAFSGRTSGGGSRSGGYGGGRTNSHSYPSSNHLSGTGTSHGNSYSGTHSYPSSDGLSGTNSVRSQSSHNSHSAYYNQKTEVHHHHYDYRPPLQINYGSVPHPVYQGRLPTYVYEYRDSGSRFDNLLTGLALYNLGRMSANQHHGYSNREYSGIPGEVCKLGARKSNGDYEETRVDCRLMSSFIWDEQSSNPVATNTHKTETNVTQVRTVVANNSTNGTTVITSTVTVKDASDMKGPSLQVTKDMTCYMIRVSTYSPMKKTVDCALLQTYATSSLHRSRATRSVPVVTLVVLSFTYLNYHSQLFPVY